MALPKSGGRAKAAFDALVLGSEGLAVGFPVPRILGESPSIKEIRDTIRKIAEVDSPVLITGETGTGKELVARAIHALSSRANFPFRAVNCAALSETLFESEFFGHAPGAFTGATGEHKGFFQACHGGTLLLDEIGELPLSIQAKLLRATEEGCVQPLGSDSVVPTDVRILAATNRDPLAEVESRKFREDLFYRLSVLSVHVPPLSTRGEDILLLGRHFLVHFSKKLKKKVRGFSDAAVERLLAYPWPGNVRELQNCMEQVVLFARNETLALEDLPEGLRSKPLKPFQDGQAHPQQLSLAEVERRYILHVLDEEGGNRTKVAEILGIDRRTLQRKLQQ